MTETTKEPTTAEAFAKYHDERAGYGGASREFHERAASHLRTQAEQLALAERRLGAIAQAGRSLLQCIESRTIITPALIQELRAALTDAPPVFTLEEVDRALREVHAGPTTDGLARALSERLAALRR